MNHVGHKIHIGRWAAWLPKSGVQWFKSPKRCEEKEKPDLAIIDSIQTIWSDKVESAPGTVSQVRAAAHELTSFAKRSNTSIVLVGHVTKEGQIAGPRVVEHMVDTVLYFEGERGNQFRIL